MPSGSFLPSLLVFLLIRVIIQKDRYAQVQNEQMFLTLLFQVPSALGHGRLIEPPSRASMWRFGFNNPPDFDDTAGYCGGITVSLQLRFQNSRDWMERRIKSNN